MNKSMLSADGSSPRGDTSLADAELRVARIERSGTPADLRPVSSDRARAQQERAGWLRTFFLTLLKIALPLAVLAAAYASARYLQATRPAPPPRQATEVRIPVRTLVAEPRTVRPQLRVFGNAVVGRQVEMRSLVGGRVIETGQSLRDGALVDEGEMLLVIDPFDYQSQINETMAQIDEARARLAEFEVALAVEESNLKFAREQLKIAADDLARAEELARQGNLAQRSVDERKLIFSQRQQNVRRDENNVKLQQARIAQQNAAIARLENALASDRKRLADTRLVAPFAAYITDVGAQVGRMLNENDRVATLIDRNWIEVSFTLTDPQFGRLRATDGQLIGREVDVIWELGRAQQKYAATIERIAARVASDTGGVDVFARVRNPTEGVPLRPGAFVRVILDDVEYRDVITLPADSVYDARTVYVVEDGRLQERTVEVVGVDGADLLVRGGIEPGSRVVVTRMAAPGPGVAVEEL